MKKSGFLTMLAMATCLMVFGTGCSGSNGSTTANTVTPSGPNPVATITMNSGKTIKVELYPSVAPNTVNNFISLDNPSNSFKSLLLADLFSLIMSSIFSCAPHDI